MLDQAERVQGQLVDLQAVRLVYRIVIELSTIASIDIVALKKNNYRYEHVILSTVLQASRYTHETLNEAMATPQLTLVSYTAYFTRPTWQTQNHT